MEALLAAMPNLEIQDNDKCTPLHVAALQGHAEVVEALLAAGASTEARDHDQLTPLDYAKREQQYAVVTILQSARPTAPKKMDSIDYADDDDEGDAWGDGKPEKPAEKDEV